jgi:hypothetical protein
LRRTFAAKTLGRVTKLTLVIWAHIHPGVVANSTGVVFEEGVFWIAFSAILPISDTLLAVFSTG